MKKHKIHEKKPRDSIRHKTPDSSSLPSVSEKTPKESGENFVLPPKKASHHEKIPKSEVKVPTSHGSQKIRQKDVTPLNKSPEREYNSFRTVQEKQPTDQGKRIQKSKVPSRTPRRTPPKREILPSRKGIDESKKSRKSINKPLPKQIRTKTPKKTSVRLPPATSRLEKKKLRNASNKSPPPKIVHKTPEKKKALPPTAVRDKIPKTRIKTKKPN